MNPTGNNHSGDSDSGNASGAPFDPQSVDALLPWYATGALSAEDRQAVDEALAGDPELQAHLALIAEERDEIVHASETITAPSRRIADRVFAAIAEEAEAAEAAKEGRGDTRTPVGLVAGQAAPSRQSWLARFGSWLGGFSPAGLGLAGAAALILIALQAGLVGLVAIDRQTASTYQTASGDRPQAAGTETLIAFQPETTLAAMTELLDSHRARIVEGPLPGGVFRVRVTAAAPEDAQRAIAALRDDPRVRFVAPAPAP